MNLIYFPFNQKMRGLAEEYNQPMQAFIKVIETKKWFLSINLGMVF